MTVNPFISPSSYAKICASVTTAVLFLLIVINVAVSSQVTYWGYELGQLQHKAEYLEEANRLLSQDISHQTSLTKVTRNAASLGYNHDIAIVRINPPNPVAFADLFQP